jgi:flagellar biosynthesis/type III secretory pathway chaperone
MTVCDTSRLTAADVELLEHHLGDEISAQNEVLGRLTEQERLLVKNDVAGLKKFLAESDPLLARLQTLTEMRMRIMTLLSRRLGIQVDACTVRVVLESVDADDRQRLASSAAELHAILKNVEKRTRRVNVLLRHAAETNESLLHALLGDEAPLRLYRPDGQRTPSTGLPHFARDF